MDSNRTRVSLIRETTLGTTPGSPRMRTGRITGESLQFSPQFFTPNEIRSDRMSTDPAKINEMIGGGVNFELSYPNNKTFLSEIFASALYNDWVRLPEWDNSEVASSITGIATNVITVVNQSGSGGFSGSAVIVGHLVRLTGFTDANQGAVNRVTASTATSITAGTLTNNASPPATARVKVVGFEGASGDITATATGLGSTTANFVNMGLAVGNWIKIGGAAAGNQFATAALNGWARVTAVAASALTLDNLPTGWATDAGTSKTIRIFFGDTIKNGSTRIGMSLEKSFLGQATPTHVIYRGQVVDRFNLSYQTDAACTGSAEFMGMGAAAGTVANGTSYDGTTTGQVFTGNASVARIAEGGSAIATANWARRLDIAISNNMRRINGLGRVGAYDLGVGELGLTGTLETYFSSNVMYAKLLAGTVSNLGSVVTANSQALVMGLPRVTFTDGNPAAGGKNQDVTLPLQFVTSYDTATNSEIMFDRLEYYEG